MTDEQLEKRIRAALAAAAAEVEPTGTLAELRARIAGQQTTNGGPMPNVNGRDYLAEMDARMDAVTQDEWVAAAVAAKLYAELLESDPELLDGWLHAVAVEALRLVLVARSRSRRTTARRAAAARSFADEAATGDAPRLLGLFTVDYVVSPDRVRKRACDMTGPEHAWVAGRYEDTAAESRMLAAFHRAVAEQVGDRRTSEVLGEAEYERLYLSITRDTP